MPKVYSGREQSRFAIGSTITDGERVGVLSRVTVVAGVPRAFAIRPGVSGISRRWSAPVANCSNVASRRGLTE